MKSEIINVESVKFNGKVIVSLSGMRNDLNCLEIDPNDIKSWFGIDKDGYSVEYRIQVGQWIDFDDVTECTHEVINPRFIQIP